MYKILTDEGIKNTVYKSNIKWVKDRFENFFIIPIKYIDNDYSTRAVSFFLSIADIEPNKISIDIEYTIYKKPFLPINLTSSGRRNIISCYYSMENISFENFNISNLKYVFNLDNLTKCIDYITTYFINKKILTVEEVLNIL